MAYEADEVPYSGSGRPPFFVYGPNISILEVQRLHIAGRHLEHRDRGKRERHQLLDQRIQQRELMIRKPVETPCCTEMHDPHIDK